MKLIGLTGGAGSGKSTVGSMFHELGAAIVDADEATHAVYAPGTPGFDAIVREFGPQFVRAGEIDRARLGELVFRDPEARQRLNGIVHPMVRDWMAQATVEAADLGADVVVQDVPLLFESGMQGLFASTVLVYVPAQIQLARLVEGRGLSEARANALLAAQMPIDEKRPLATYVIDNTGSREKTREQVERIWAGISAS